MKRIDVSEQRKMLVWCDDTKCKYIVQVLDHYACNPPEDKREGIEMDKNGRCRTRR